MKLIFQYDVQHQESFEKEIKGKEILNKNENANFVSIKSKQ